MAPIKINFSDVEDFELLDAGVYDAVVEDIEERESQSSDYPYLNWTLVVAGEENDGRKLWFMTSLSPKALWKLKETLLSLGMSEEDVEDDFDFDPQDFIGMDVRATVVQESYKGRMQNRVEDIALRPTKSKKSKKGRK